jgi:hypothetical protein
MGIEREPAYPLRTFETGVCVLFLENMRALRAERGADYPLNEYTTAHLLDPDGVYSKASAAYSREMLGHISRMGGSLIEVGFVEELDRNVPNYDLLPPQFIEPALG